jgi:hypothetical protein
MFIARFVEAASPPVGSLNAPTAAVNLLIERREAAWLTGLCGYSRPAARRKRARVSGSGARARRITGLGFARARGNKSS